MWASTGFASQCCDGCLGEVLPVDDSRSCAGVFEQVAGERRSDGHRCVEYSGEKSVSGENVAASSDQVDREVFEAVHHAQQSGIGSLRGFVNDGVRGGWSGEFEEMCTFVWVEAKRASERLENIGRDVGLPALFNSAVVVGADAGEVGEFLSAQSGDPSGAGHRVDASLCWGDAVASGSEEVCESPAIRCHALTLDRVACAMGGHDVPCLLGGEVDTHKVMTKTSTTSSPDVRTAIVTGSTSGIGAAIAKRLAGSGTRVLVTGRDTDRGHQIVAGIVDVGGSAVFVASDLSRSYADLRSFVAEATDTLGGRVDILVNNAGVYPATSTTDLSDDDLDTMLAVNVRAPHVLVAEMVPPMVERGSGVIVNIGSWMAQVGSPMAAMYTATKAADEQLTRTWAAEYGPSGVRVNTVAPGVTLTPGNEAFREVLDQMTASTPAGVVVQPDDIAAAVAFLASDDASMIHGTTLYVDGGISATKLS